MPVVGFAYQEPWKVARWAFRLLIDNTLPTVDEPRDAEALKQAVALDGLHFDLLPHEQAVRIAGKLAAAAEKLRLQLQHSDLSDSRDRGLVEYLPELEMKLADVLDSGPAAGSA